METVKGDSVVNDLTTCAAEELGMCIEYLLTSGSMHINTVTEDIHYRLTGGYEYIRCLEIYARVSFVSIRRQGLGTYPQIWTDLQPHLSMAQLRPGKEIRKGVGSNVSKQCVLLTRKVCGIWTILGPV